MCLDHQAGIENVVASSGTSLIRQIEDDTELLQISLSFTMADPAGIKLPSAVLTGAGTG